MAIVSIGGAACAGVCSLPSSGPAGWMRSAGNGGCRFNDPFLYLLRGLAHLRFKPLLFRFLLDPMHEPHRGRAPVAARAGMEFFEGVEVLAPDAAALGQQGGEVIRPGAKGRGLF